MPDGGRITLSTRRGPPGFVQVSVADTGPGIPEEIRSRVFDPFFTTKPPGVGTGLGLTQVYGFARHAGGTVEIQSRPGRGAAIVIRLPTVSPASPEPSAETARAAETSLSGRKILLLDDNADVRRVTAAGLADRGAVVIEGSSAAEGLALLEAGRFDLLISDIVMPGDQDGLGLAGLVRVRWPALPVLLLSGYSDSLAEAVARDFQVMRKPYELADLARLAAEASRNGCG
jgi:CheY-like chemotaxis protein